MVQTLRVAESDVVRRPPPGWREIEAPSGVDDLWLRPDIELVAWPRGVVDDAAHEATIAAGRNDAEVLPVRVTRPGRCGDLLWTQGSCIKIASRRFVDALRHAGIAGFNTFPVAIDHPALTGKYVGLAVTPSASGELRPVHEVRPSWSFFVSGRVIDVLHRAGVSAFDVVSNEPDTTAVD